jgi:hypothetical protein
MQYRECYLRYTVDLHNACLQRGYGDWYASHGYGYRNGHSHSYQHQHSCKYIYFYPYQYSSSERYEQPSSSHSNVRTFREHPGCKHSRFLLHPTERDDTGRHDREMDEHPRLTHHYLGHCTMEQRDTGSR